MPIEKPYYRIYRPNIKKAQNDLYLVDPRYADDRFFLIHSYHILESDLKKIFEYIEPADENLETFSLRTYEIFLRACTEFENNAKIILRSNNYPRSNKLNFNDYRKLIGPLKLHEYELKINIWQSKIEKIFKPFEDWSSPKSNRLSWYDDYNNVKHDRSLNFKKANISNTVKAVGAVFIILYAQFAWLAFNPYQDLWELDNDRQGFESYYHNLFSIKPPAWQLSEKYDFNWEKLKNDPDPFQYFSF